MKTPAFAGAVYQSTEGDTHVLDYTNSQHLLFRGLADELFGGRGHGRRLAQMGVRAIRVYELPVENPQDIGEVKQIFRRLYAKYDLRVLIGDWAGLHTKMNFRSGQDVQRLQRHLQKLIEIYAEEPWVLGWQLGNENNYHVLNGVLGSEIAMDAAAYYSFMDGLAGIVKQELGNRHLMQFVSLGQGDLTEAEAQLIGKTKNFDAVGINCYRPDPNAFEEVISLAARHIPLPIYFAEIGQPADSLSTAATQSQYLQNVCTILFAHGAGGLRSGNVIGAFIHEATDEPWKRTERGQQGDAHYGFLGKAAEQDLAQYLHRYRDFCTWILPTNDAPATLIQSAWLCLEGPYTRTHSRLYGQAMAYANRAITLYQDAAMKQQLELATVEAPISQAGRSNYWAVHTVGTGYFIIGESWMLQSYDFKGFEHPAGTWQWLLDLADFRGSQPLTPAARNDIAPTNSAACLHYARQVFAALRTSYPYAHLQQANGRYLPLERAVKARFPETCAPYIPLSWKNGILFVAIVLGLLLGCATLARWGASRNSVPSTSVLSFSRRVVFLLALIFNLACLFWFMNWWFHPVRVRYHTVHPVLFVVLSTIGAMGVLFYFYIWYLLWNMRRPVPMKAAPGRKVAIVTTRVASEPADSVEPTLRKMNGVTYPHDSYLLDEENSAEARALCQGCHVIHFSRKGIEKYNQPSGKFQARTKGGNLNSWLYEHGHKYEIVTFLDPDHAPRPDFLDKVLGYFDHPSVAFVQGPQVFHNRSENWITRGASEQSYFFYGPIEMGLFGVGACVVNGSHSTFRVSDLLSLKGESYAVHDADDILTSIRIHAAGKTGVYVPEVIAEGLAPDTWDEYAKQQRRWAYSMFQLFFHYYVPELLGMPLRCKTAYLLLAWFYFITIGFIGLLLLPFASAITGSPAVNANIVAFSFRFLPFLALHSGILLLLGHRFLIQYDRPNGFWYRAGILRIALWWDNLCALVKGLRVKRVTDRVVAAKWKAKPAGSARTILPHLILTVAASLTFLWIYQQTDRRQTVWGTLLFLGIIVLSQGFVVFRILIKPRRRKPGWQKAPAARPLSIRTGYSHQPRRS